MPRWPRQWRESPIGWYCERCNSRSSLSRGHRYGISKAHEQEKLCGRGNWVCVDHQGECVDDVQVMRDSATACAACQATEIRVCIGRHSELHVTSTRARVSSMKTPVQCHPQTHYIGDHSKHKGNNGECGDHTTLHAALGKAVNAKNPVGICLMRTGRPNFNQPRCKEHIRH
jgi:hypothetical protein